MHTGDMNIANAVINVSNGNNADNLLKRAEQFEERGEFNTKQARILPPLQVVR